MFKLYIYNKIVRYVSTDYRVCTLILPVQAAAEFRVFQVTHMTNTTAWKARTYCNCMFSRKKINLEVASYLSVIVKSCMICLV